MFEDRTYTVRGGFGTTDDVPGSQASTAPDPRLAVVAIVVIDESEGL